VVLSLRSKSSLAAENFFLRKELAFYQERGIKPRRTSQSTGVTLLWLSRWFDWRSALTVVTPQTFIAWHRQGFGFYWRRKCRSGRPPIPLELQRLILEMTRENPQDFAQMVLTQGDQPIQTFPSEGPDQPFAERIGLRAPHRCLDDLKAEVGD
jgi:hypothetical protein